MAAVITLAAGAAGVEEGSVVEGTEISLQKVNALQNWATVKSKITDKQVRQREVRLLRTPE